MAVYKTRKAHEKVLQNIRLVLHVACSLGRFGTGCQFPCSGNCINNDPCNHTNGSCDRGCAVRWSGPLCNQSEAYKLT